MKHGHRPVMAELGVAALAVALTLIAFWGQGALVQGDVIYVDADATGLNEGSSWTDAFTTLQPALEAAVSGDQIWVAEGIYKPTARYGGSEERNRSFQLKNGVGIYGGFAGTESSLDQRDWVTHVTILSGDLNGDDGPDFSNNGENSYHVFYHPSGTALDSSAVLDGLTITGGNADGIIDWVGGGMNNSSSSPTVTNCTFEDNTADYIGGGMANLGSDARPTVAGCTFKGNSAKEGGGMVNLRISAGDQLHLRGQLS